MRHHPWVLRWSDLEQIVHSHCATRGSLGAYPREMRSLAWGGAQTSVFFKTSQVNLKLELKTTGLKSPSAGIEGGDVATVLYMLLTIVLRNPALGEELLWATQSQAWEGNQVHMPQGKSLMPRRTVVPLINLGNMAEVAGLSRCVLWETSISVWVNYMSVFFSWKYRWIAQERTLGSGCTLGNHQERLWTELCPP